MGFELGRRRGPRTLIGLTPLIDVVFILLVFFMLASNFRNWRAIGLDAPARGGGQGDGITVVLLLAADGRAVLDGEAVAGEALGRRLAALAARAEPPPVVVRAEPGVALQRAVDALAAARGAGLARVTLGAAR
jgi:biopolymer transport protein ExbD